MTWCNLFKSKIFWIITFGLCLIFIYAWTARYSYYSGNTGLYKVDRWTGKTWVIQRHREFLIQPYNNTIAVIHPTQTQTPYNQALKTTIPDPVTQTPTQPQVQSQKSNPPPSTISQPQYSSEEIKKRRDNILIEYTKNATVKRYGKTLTVLKALENKLKQVKGPLEINGWHVKQISDDIYLISFTWFENQGLLGWYFEVNVTSGVVRDIQTDPDLAKYYGIEYAD